MYCQNVCTCTVVYEPEHKRSPHSKFGNNVLSKLLCTHCSVYTESVRLSHSKFGNNTAKILFMHSSVWTWTEKITTWATLEVWKQCAWYQNFCTRTVVYTEAELVNLNTRVWNNAPPNFCACTVVYEPEHKVHHTQSLGTKYWKNFCTRTVVCIPSRWITRGLFRTSYYW